MKKLLILVIFSIIFFATSKANADCDIRPSSVTDLNDLYNFTHGELKRPRLKINTGKLKSVDSAESQPYNMGTLKKKYYFGAYTQGNKITIYSKLFKLHDTCDEHVKAKLRGMLTHEYTHYLDSYSVLSNLIDLNNDEQTAIISEHVLSKLVWGNMAVQYTRPLTQNEQEKAAVLSNFFVKNTQN